jgi:uncharacterized hydrophobic protein (TIGR00271 family)
MPVHTIRDRVERLLRVDRESKPEVYLRVFDSAELMSLNYALELLFSAGIATLGLILNSPAVVIGAMLISPLMGPILAGGLALASADVYLGFKSLTSIMLSTVSAVLFSAAVVWIAPFHYPTSEILARTQPNLLDLGVALLSGLAGSIVVCRGGTGGGVTALPGVAIAVALMPPLCTVGFGVGSGFSWPIIRGAGMLFLTNLAAITTSAFLVFYIVQMDAPDLRMKIDYAIMERASRNRFYHLLENTRLSRAFGDIGKLRWRVLMALAVLAILFVPLRESLNQVRDETIARAAAREAVRNVLPLDAVVSQQLEPGRDRIVIRLIATVAPDQQKVREAERFLLRRTGKEASILIRKVAGEEELAILRESLRVPVPPPVRSIDSVRSELLSRLEGSLKETWPSNQAEVTAYELGFDHEGVVVRVRYKAPNPMDEIAQGMLSQVLQSRLQVTTLRVVLDHEPPPADMKAKTNVTRRKR